MCLVVALWGLLMWRFGAAFAAAPTRAHAHTAPPQTAPIMARAWN
jgi:hypothetical protein